MKRPVHSPIAGWTLSARFKQSARLKRRGIALWETAMSTFLVGMVLVTATTTSGTSVRMQTKACHRAKAGYLAHALIGEMLELSYMQPGQTSSAIGRESGESATSRIIYNDVDDYNGWTDSPPQNKDGSVMPDLTSWSRQVVVEWVSPTTLTQPSPGSSTETGMKRLTVNVLRNGTLILTQIATKANAP
jgi:hypothetical protein